MYQTLRGGGDGRHDQPFYNNKMSALALAYHALDIFRWGAPVKTNPNKKFAFLPPSE